MNCFTNFLFIVTMVAMFDGGMGSSTIILKEYYIYVSNLIAIYSKGFFWIFLMDFFADFTLYVLFIDMVAMMVGRLGHRT